MTMKPPPPLTVGDYSHDRLLTIVDIEWREYQMFSENIYIAEHYLVTIVETLGLPWAKYPYDALSRASNLARRTLPGGSRTKRAHQVMVWQESGHSYAKFRVYYRDERSLEMPKKQTEPYAPMPTPVSDEEMSQTFPVRRDWKAISDMLWRNPGVWHAVAHDVIASTSSRLSDVYKLETRLEQVNPENNRAKTLYARAPITGEHATKRQAELERILDVHTQYIHSLSELPKTIDAETSRTMDLADDLIMSLEKYAGIHL